jgi:glycosyltransferase involved in cell wall biosynthesis
MLPGADLLTTLSAPERLPESLRDVDIKTTWMQFLPNKARWFRYYFLIYPFAIEGVDLTSYDLVVTSCFGYAKGVKRRGTKAVHVCYCHNPMRWVWRTEDYIARENLTHWKASLLRMLLKPLKLWEQRAARQPDYYIANSQNVAKRLKTSFGIESTVISPPIDVSRFSISKEVGDYYLVLSRLVPYKRIDLAVQACTQAGVKLVVIGDGPDRERLQNLAGPTVTFLGRLPDNQINQCAAQCRALLFPGEEDFGMSLLEINAAGRPVIAYRAGGASETIIDGLNGIFFDEASTEALLIAMHRFDTMAWHSEDIRRHAERYDTKLFERRVLDFLESTLPPEYTLQTESKTKPSQCLESSCT